MVQRNSVHDGCRQHTKHEVVGDRLATTQV